MFHPKELAEATLRNMFGSTPERRNEARAKFGKLVEWHQQLVPSFSEAVRASSFLFKFKPCPHQESADRRTCLICMIVWLDETLAGLEAMRANPMVIGVFRDRPEPKDDDTFPLDMPAEIRNLLTMLKGLPGVNVQAVRISKKPEGGVPESPIKPKDYPN